MSQIQRRPCKCHECHTIHSDFIEHFGRWPNKTHEESQRMKRRRIESERSWNRALS